jgi:hypothetical protein
MSGHDATLYLWKDPGEFVSYKRQRSLKSYNRKGASEKRESIFKQLPGDKSIMLFHSKIHLVSNVQESNMAGAIHFAFLMFAWEATRTSIHFLFFLLRQVIEKIKHLGASVPLRWCSVE